MSDEPSGKPGGELTNVPDIVKEPLIILWEKLEIWQQDNHYIRSGYRPASNNYWKSALSLSYLHNESVNIYTHLLGAIFFAIVGPTLWFQVRSRYSTATNVDLYVIGCFFAGAVACLGLSAAYHTISNHSQIVSRFGNKLDYLGIVFLIWGSFIPSIYYGFTCRPDLITAYWGMITTIGAGCATVCVSPTFASPKWRPFRAGMFSAMGLSAVVPVLHGLRIFGVDRMVDLIGLPWLVLQGALYVTGAALYAARVPERFNPGYFDIWGSSHQIFHVLVLLAAASHLYGLINAFDFNHSLGRSYTCAAV